MGTDTKVNCTKTSANHLGRLARRLFKEYPIGHEALHIRQPSTRVAIDCLLWMGAYHLEGVDIKQPISNNLFARIEESQREYELPDEEGED